jgi:hypothetical protein
MTVYRDLWSAVCVPVALLGLTVALLLSPVALASVFVAFAIIGTVRTLRGFTSADRPSGDRTGRTLRGALLWGGTAGALVGHTVLLGAGVLLLVGLVLASSPYCVRGFRRWLGSGLASRSSEKLRFEPSVDLGGLTDQQLCRAWSTSYGALHRQSSAAQVAAAVAERAKYLDELERRNPDGFATWLASGAHSPGNPLPYLAGRVEPAEINWDELTQGRDR